ncbi:MAG: FHA domain-containing protein [Verrucomicrobiaceae bacterium]|nr:FHA domain-containing protein [Verrucomicrobiaceae bacterium]
MAASLKTPDLAEEFLLEDFNLIGRSQDATIRLTDNGVSRQHATIRRDGRLYWLADLGSANGSFVNEVAISTARALRHGDRLQFGTSVFVFDNDDSDHTRDLSSQTQVLRTVALPVKTVKATLLVGDLRNFTQISSQLTAEEVAAMLREWYADCEAILKPRGAIIDKFIGDGVFAYWPSNDEESRARATEAARLLSMPETSISPTRKWLRDNLGTEVYCHVGLNVGEVALGAMGRGVNTAVGEAVNVTFRIESLTRKLQVPVLASAAFVQTWSAGVQHFTPAGIHPVKGQPEPVEVYALANAAHVS